MPIAPTAKAPAAARPAVPEAPRAAAPSSAPHRPTAESLSLFETDEEEQSQRRSMRSTVSGLIDLAAYARDPCGDGPQTPMNLNRAFSLNAAWHASLETHIALVSPDRAVRALPSGLGFSRFFSACISGQLDTVVISIENSQFKSPESTRVLLETREGTFRLSPLMATIMAARLTEAGAAPVNPSTSHVGVVAALLTAGCRTDNRDICGCTPLHYATVGLSAKEMSLGIARMLIHRGVDVNALNRFGQNAIWNAAYAMNVPATRLLMEAGADPTIKHANPGFDPSPCCAMDAAHNTPEIAAIVESAVRRGRVGTKGTLKGQRVKLAGLQQQSMNGRTGVCGTFDCFAGRYEFIPDSGAPVKVRPENLLPIDATEATTPAPASKPTAAAPATTSSTNTKAAAVPPPAVPGKKVSGLAAPVRGGKSNSIAPLPAPKPATTAATTSTAKGTSDIEAPVRAMLSRLMSPNPADRPTMITADQARDYLLNAPPCGCPDCHGEHEDDDDEDDVSGSHCSCPRCREVAEEEEEEEEEEDDEERCNCPACQARRFNGSEEDEDEDEEDDEEEEEEEDDEERPLCTDPNCAGCRARALRRAEQAGARGEDPSDKLEDEPVSMPRMPAFPFGPGFGPAGFRPSSYGPDAYFDVLRPFRSTDDADADDLPGLISSDDPVVQGTTNSQGTKGGASDSAGRGRGGAAAGNPGARGRGGSSGRGAQRGGRGGKSRGGGGRGGAQSNPFAGAPNPFVARPPPVEPATDSAPSFAAALRSVQQSVASAPAPAGRTPATPAAAPVAASFSSTAALAAMESLKGKPKGKSRKR